ncbi:MAG: zinc-dependent metalloprotease family protein [Myxococcota bacterium]
MAFLKVLHRGLPFASLVLVGAAACSSSSEVVVLPYGDGCTADSCGRLACLEQPNFPGGYCTTVCEDECPETGGECVPEILGGICLRTCGSEADCRDGYQCWRGTCRPSCGGDPECGGSGARCEAGRCTGAECVGDADCAGTSTCSGGRCVAAPVDAGFDGAPEAAIEIGPVDVGSPCDGCEGVCADGVCLPSCTDRASCESSSLVCAPIPVDDTGDGAADRLAGGCIDSRPALEFLAGRCATDDDCESSTCHMGQCTEVCDGDDDCLPGHRCREIQRLGLPFPACWYSDPVRGTETVTLLEENVSGGTRLSRGRVAVPPDAISVSFLLQQEDPRALNLTFFQLFDPAGATPFDLDEIAELRDTPIRWIPGQEGEASMMLVPNTTTDRYALQSGRYSVIAGTFFEETTSDVTLSAIIRRSPDGRAGGDIHVRVHYTSGLGLNAGNVASSSRVAATIQRINEIYAASGLRFLVDEYVAVASSALAVIDTREGPDSELASLFRLSGPSAQPVLDIYLVRGFSADDGLLGVAGGIPGPAGVGQTSSSGVVIAFDQSIVGTTGIFSGQILAHEIGHFLGLYHSTEQPGVDAFGGGDVIADTALGNRRNLMYFAVQEIRGELNDDMSTGQSFVAARTPLAR